MDHRRVSQEIDFTIDQLATRIMNRVKDSLKNTHRSAKPSPSLTPKMSIEMSQRKSAPHIYVKKSYIGNGKSTQESQQITDTKASRNGQVSVSHSSHKSQSFHKRDFMENLHKVKVPVKKQKQSEITPFSKKPPTQLKSQTSVKSLLKSPVTPVRQNQTISTQKNPNKSRSIIQTNSLHQSTQSYTQEILSHLRNAKVFKDKLLNQLI